MKDGTIGWNTVNIYDHACNRIGGSWGLKQGDAINSSLPYTVVLDRLVTSRDIDQIRFCYGGYCNHDSFSCHTQADNPGWEINVCTHGFPC
jgi:hypothetical protein